MTETNSKRVNWMPLAIGVYALWVLLALGTDFSLYADGAHEFLRVLEAQTFVPLWWSRHFTYYTYQFPLVVAIKLGVTSLPWLRFALGLGCFLPWVSALLLCRWVSREHFWLAVVGCGAGYLNGAYMPVGQHTVAHAEFWPALFVLLFARPLKPGAILILLVMATGLQFSYESQAFLSVPLLLLSVWRLSQEKRAGSGLTRFVFLVAAALFLSSILNGTYSILMSEAPANLNGFKSGTLKMLRQPGWTLTWTLLWGALAIAACWSEKMWRTLTGKNGLYLGVATTLVWGFWPLLAPNQVDTGVQYDNRATNLLVPLALLPVGLVLSVRPAWLASRRERLVQFAAVLLLAQSLWHCSNMFLWQRDVLAMKAALGANRGVIPLRMTGLQAAGMLGRDLAPDAVSGRFEWAWPCLSIAITDKKEINSLICSEVVVNPYLRRYVWQPFDPFKPETFLKLNHYGINCSNYVTALREQLKN